MPFSRVIPVLLLREGGLVKSVKFGKHRYIGDPINAVKILNEKEVDELVLLDIDATIQNRKPDKKVISEIASECFMPLCYGGGVRNLEDIREIFGLGVEKVSINSHAVEDPEFVRRAAGEFGSQSITVSIDVKRGFFGRYEVCTHGGRKTSHRDPVDLAREMEAQGAGELLLTAIDRDGTMEGYDLSLLKKITGEVSIPVIACGGAGSLEDLAKAVHDGGACAAAAGSLFVFYGKHKAVLINYPSPNELAAMLAAPA